MNERPTVILSSILYLFNHVVWFCRALTCLLFAPFQKTSAPFSQLITIQEARICTVYSGSFGQVTRLAYCPKNHFAPFQQQVHNKQRHRSFTIRSLRRGMLFINRSHSTRLSSSLFYLYSGIAPEQLSASSPRNKLLLKGVHVLFLQLHSS